MRYREDASYDGCVRCPANTYSNALGATSSADCTRCDEGYVSSDGSATCSECPPGEFGWNLRLSQVVLQPMLG